VILPGLAYFLVIAGALFAAGVLAVCLQRPSAGVVLMLTGAALQSGVLSAYTDRSREGAMASGQALALLALFVLATHLLAAAQLESAATGPPGEGAESPAGP
jgi:NADH:ubiquinone oxidoreductase subunit K